MNTQQQQQFNAREYISRAYHPKLVEHFVEDMNVGKRLTINYLYKVCKNQKMVDDMLGRYETELDKHLQELEITTHNISESVPKRLASC